MENKKRYVAIVDFYIYSENDDDAKEQAQKIISQIEKKEDRDAKVLSMHETPFGKFNQSRKVI